MCNLRSKNSLPAKLNSQAINQFKYKSPADGKTANSQAINQLKYKSPADGKTASSQAINQFKYKLPADGKTANFAKNPDFRLQTTDNTITISKMFTASWDLFK